MHRLLPVLLLLAALPALAQWPTVARCGLTLEALSAEDLNAIANAIGRRVGVLVVEVAPGSPAAKAGLQRGDVILAFGQGGALGVDSPEATEKALAGKVGPIPVGAIRFAGEDVAMVPTTLDIPAVTATPPPPPTVDEAATRQKLAALRAAHQAGILSDAEYGAKKAELEAQLAPKTPELDPATKQKLAALDAALAAGILSQAEYDAKRAELLKGVGGVVAKADKPRYKDPRAGFEFEHPAGWDVFAYPNGTGAAATRGDALVSVMIMEKAADAGRLIGDTGAQMAKQWKNWKADWGQTQIAGAAAPRVAFSGTNPKGIKAKGLMTAQVVNGMGYLLLASGPEGAFAEVDAAWTLLVKSFSPGQAVATQRAGSIYRHPVGFSLWYPKGWSIRDVDGMLQLVPPDAVMLANGQPAEVYLFSGTGLEGSGITAPDDPRLLAFYDQQVRQLSPALQRAGTPKPVNMANGAGVLLDWTAPARDGGVILARGYAGIVKNSCIAVLGLGAQKQVEGRSADMQAIFASFGLTEGKVDPQLAGVWRMTGTYALSNEGGHRAGYETQWSKAKSVTEEQVSMQLNPDGSFVRREVGRTIVGAGSVWLDSGNQETIRRGRWFAADGMAYLISEDGKSEGYQYKLEIAPNGRRTATLTSGRVAEIWQQ